VKLKSAVPVAPAAEVAVAPYSTLTTLSAEAWVIVPAVAVGRVPSAPVTVAFPFDGAEINVAAKLIFRVLPVPGAVMAAKVFVAVTVTAFVIPDVAADVLANEIPVTVPIGDAITAAYEGTAPRIPNPNADTATSAMRLRSVFVDICFLSISRSEEFPPVGFG
jgi:hypothetical protein